MAMRLKRCHLRWSLMSVVDEVISNDDLMMEILLRLPIRQLFRSKAVCKNWHSLVSEPNFIRLFRKRNDSRINIPLGLYLRWPYWNQERYSFVPLDIENPIKPPFAAIKLNQKPESSHRMVIICSCNGLMIYGNVSKAEFCIYNPTINRFVTLPKLDGGFGWAPVKRINVILAFDPSKSLHYRVICVFPVMGPADNMYRVVIYSSESQNWRVSGQPFSSGSAFRWLKGGVYWNDAIYWAHGLEELSYFKLDQGRYYKLSNLSFPPTWHPQDYFLLVDQSHNHLLNIYLSVGCLPGMKVYQMNLDCFQWNLRYHIDLSLAPLVSPDRIRVHCFVLGEREEDSFLVLEVSRMVIRYNFVLKTFTQLCELARSSYFSFNAVPFIESLCDV